MGFTWRLCILLRSSDCPTVDDWEHRQRIQALPAGDSSSNPGFLQQNHLSSELQNLSGKLAKLNECSSDCTLSFLQIRSDHSLCFADACSFSPSRVSSVIAVGATDTADSMASFSNLGACVDVLAPGVEIISASYKDATGNL